MRQVIVATQENGRDLVGGLGEISESKAREVYSFALKNVTFLPYSVCVRLGCRFIIPVELEVPNYEESFESRILGLDVNGVKEHLSQGTATIVLWCLKEGWITEQLLKTIKDLLDRENLPYTSVLVVTSTFLPDMENFLGIPVVTYPFFEVEKWTFSSDKEKGDRLDFTEILDFREEIQKVGFLRPYRVIKYDRQPKPSRLFLQLYLRSLKSPAICSWMSKELGKKNLTVEEIRGIIQRYSEVEQYSQVEKNLYEEGGFNEELRYVQEGHRDNPIQFEKEVAFLGTINVLSETWFDLPNSVFFSEKIYKTIAGLQAFVLAGQYKSLQCLRSQGYQTFGRYWNEDYDLEVVPEIRLQKICNTVQDILKMSDEDFLEIVQDMQSVLISNQDNLIRAHSRVDRELHPVLMKYGVERKYERRLV